MNKRKILLLIQTLLCVLFAVLVAGAAITIFREGTARIANGHPLDWIYTREIAVERFKPILPVLLAGILVTVIGLVLNIRDENDGKPVRDSERMRDLLRMRTPVTPDVQTEMVKEKRIRMAAWGIFALCMVPVFLYVMNGEHFPNGELEPMFMSLLVHILPWTAIALGVQIVSEVLQDKSRTRQINLLKSAPKDGKSGTTAKLRPEGQADGSRIWLVRGVILAAAILLIILGAVTGNAREVLVKAINICTECVGLG